MYELGTLSLTRPLQRFVRPPEALKLPASNKENANGQGEIECGDAGQENWTSGGDRRWEHGHKDRCRACSKPCCLLNNVSGNVHTQGKRKTAPPSESSSKDQSARKHSRQHTQPWQSSLEME